MTQTEAITIVASLCADGVLDKKEEAILRKALAQPEPIQHCKAGPEYCWKCNEEIKPTYGSEEIRKLREVNKSLNDHIVDVNKKVEPPPWWPAIENILNEYGLQAIDFVADFKDALAQPEQEPVALPDDFELLPVDPTPEMKSAAIEVELFDHDTGKDYMLSWEEAEQIYSAMLNAAPIPPQRKPLTDEQREEIAKGWRGRNWTVGDIIDATEAAHGIKGNA